jgi:uncharacterized protein
VQRVMNLVPLPVGINVLRNDGTSAMAIAACVGAQFIRVNVLTGVMATDQGLIEGQAHQLLRYRRELGSDVQILADVLVKHARPLGSPNLTTAVQETIERGLAMDAAKGVPLFIGSGANWENIPDLIPAANGVIVASSLKRGGQVTNRVDPIRVSRFVEAMRRSVANRESVVTEKSSVTVGGSGG